jgi:hypothetical protein
MYNIPEHLQQYEWYEKHLAWLGYDVDAKPEQANLREADLREADLYRADLRYANLCEADLYRADLREVDLRGADLRYADLDFSCWPLSCGSFNVITDYQQKAQLAYHWLRMSEDENEELTKSQREKLVAARGALLPLANDWNGIEKHHLENIDS